MLDRRMWRSVAWNLLDVRHGCVSPKTTARVFEACTHVLSAKAIIDAPPAFRRLAMFKSRVRCAVSQLGRFLMDDEVSGMGEVFRDELRERGPYRVRLECLFCRIVRDVLGPMAIEICVHRHEIAPLKPTEYAQELDLRSVDHTVIELLEAPLEVMDVYGDIDKCDGQVDPRSDLYTSDDEDASPADRNQMLAMYASDNYHDPESLIGIVYETVVDVMRDWVEDMERALHETEFYRACTDIAADFVRSKIGALKAEFALLFQECVSATAEVWEVPMMLTGEDLAVFEHPVQSATAVSDSASDDE